MIIKKIKLNLISLSAQVSETSLLASVKICCVKIDIIQCTLHKTIIPIVCTQLHLNI